MKLFMEKRNKYSDVYFIFIKFKGNGEEGKKLEEENQKKEE